MFSSSRVIDRNHVLIFFLLQILLITDLLFAYTKKEFYSINGVLLDEIKKSLRLELVY